jgi:AraC family transcriptional regulator
MHPVTIQDLEPSRAAGILHRGPYPDIGKAFQQLSALLGPRNLFSQVRGMVAVYHDTPGCKPEAEQRSHAAVIIGDDFPAGVEGLEYFDLVGGKHAVLEHKGPYATLGDAYQWLYGTWLPQSGETPRDAPPVEVYVNDPRNTPADELRTDIRVPLA